jgi:hypothetical protein
VVGDKLGIGQIVQERNAKDHRRNDQQIRVAQPPVGRRCERGGFFDWAHSGSPSFEASSICFSQQDAFILAEFVIHVERALDVVR